MPIDAIIQIVSAALGIVAAVAPTVLAGITGQPTDEAAIAAATTRVRAIRHSPALSAIDAERIRTIVRGGPLTPEDAAVLPDDGDGA
jgi:hypothetical protein